MGNRHNHGSVGLRNGQPQLNSASLSSAVAAQLQQESAARQAQAYVEQTIVDTGKQIFAQLVVHHLPVPAEGEGMDEDALRAFANFSVETAKYYAERLGMVRIEKPAEQTMTETPEQEPESSGEGSNIILP